MINDDTDPRPVDQPYDEAWVRLKQIGRLHSSDRTTGELCRECVSPWPCRTHLIANGRLAA